MLENGITFQRDAVLGAKVPDIDRVYDGATRSLNRCTPGGAFRLSGRDFGLEPDGTVLTLGVFLTPAVRINSYSDWTPTEIMGSWPSGLVGAQRLSVVARYDTGASNRAGIYGTNLTP